MIARPFPAAPAPVRQVIDRLSTAPDFLSQAERDAQRRLDRPWDPASCSTEMRAELWPWLDDVAGWINHEYAWQTIKAIPACWPQHPHLVHELAVVACLRAAAGAALGAQPLEEWHRYVLVGFLERMAERLGPVGCPPGRHTDWPGRSRHIDFTTAEAQDRRYELIEDDTGGDQSPPTAPPSPAPPRRPPPTDPQSATGGRRLSAVRPPDEGVSR